MPIYEYTCQKCKAHTEILQKMTDKPLTRCKKCGGKLEKQWSQTGFQFKGTGWYVTDYAGKKSDKKETEAKSETKAEAKTETKSEPKTGGEAKQPAAKTSTSSKTTSGD